MAVRWGTRADQETIVGTLGTLPSLIRERGMKPPAPIIVGEVVGLREKLDWYGRLPLFGRRIVVTGSSYHAWTSRAPRDGKTIDLDAEDYSPGPDPSSPWLKRGED